MIPIPPYFPCSTAQSAFALVFVKSWQIVHTLMSPCSTNFHFAAHQHPTQVNINIIMKFFSRVVALAALSGAASSAYAKETSASIIVSDSHIRWVCPSLCTKIQHAMGLGCSHSYITFHMTYNTVHGRPPRNLPFPAFPVFVVSWGSCLQRLKRQIPRVLFVKKHTKKVPVFVN